MEELRRTGKAEPQRPEGPFHIGSTKTKANWKVFWEGNTLPQSHPTKSSAEAHFSTLLEQRTIRQRAAEVDISRDVDPKAPKDLTNIIELVKRHEALSLELSAKLAEVDALNERIEKIVLDQLPAVMVQLGLPKLPINITENNGLIHQVDVRIEEVIRASIPSKTAIEKARTEEERAELVERKDKAFAFLRETNAESLIKNLIIVTVPKGKDAQVAKVILFAEKLKMSASRDESVHPSTLVKHVRETLEAGQPIPFDVFNISTGKMARINNPKLKEDKTNGKNNAASKESDYPF